MEKHGVVSYEEFGAYEKVLRYELGEIPKPVSGEVRVRLEFATINPSDYGRIDGRYGHLPKLPAVGGREGVGIIDALGEGVEGVEVGQRVRFCTEGAWQTHACLKADELSFIPEGVPSEQASLAFINPPTAYCLLTQFGALKEGDWVLQNAGNSAVGISVIQLAKQMGLKTISQVRREELVEPLKALGADVVVLEDSKWESSVGELCEGKEILLALNSIGGESAITQIKALGTGGTQVSFGGMVGDRVRFPTRYLIFNDIRLVGFWWDAFCRRAKASEVDAIMQAVFARMRSGDLKIPISGIHTLPDFKAALAQDRGPRLGKVLLKPESEN